MNDGDFVADVVITGTNIMIMTTMTIAMSSMTIAVIFIKVMMLCFQNVPLKYDGFFQRCALRDGTVPSTARFVFAELWEHNASLAVTSRTRASDPNG